MTAKQTKTPARIAHDTARRNWRAATKAHDRAPVIAAHAEAVRLSAAKENAYDQFRAALDALAATN